MDIVSCIFGWIYFLFFRVYIFQELVTIIENKCQGMFLHDFLAELRKNKQILFYANLIFLLLTIEMYDIYSQLVRTYPFIAFVFFGKRTRKMGKNIGALTFPEF